MTQDLAAAGTITVMTRGETRRLTMRARALGRLRSDTDRRANMVCACTVYLCSRESHHAVCQWFLWHCKHRHERTQGPVPCTACLHDTEQWLYEGLRLISGT